MTPKLDTLKIPKSGHLSSKTLGFETFHDLEREALKNFGKRIHSHVRCGFMLLLACAPCPSTTDSVVLCTRSLSVYMGLDCSVHALSAHLQGN